LVDENGIIEQLDAMFLESLHIKVPSPDTDFIETGMLDSLQLVELLLQLEQRFDIRITIDDIELDDLRTLARLARLVAARIAPTGVQTVPPSSSEVNQGVAAG
jgi:D-alanine--poly(phosphoribitol) ligase subunit 2